MYEFLSIISSRLWKGLPKGMKWGVPFGLYKSACSCHALLLINEKTSISLCFSMLF